jgi:hypothetical protein
MDQLLRPALFHLYWRCEKCRELTDCTYNVKIDRWLCCKDALALPLKITDYAWSSLEGVSKRTLRADDA